MIARKKVAILGSTGSIGKQCVEVIKKFPEEFEVYALSANTNYELLLAQAKSFGTRKVCVCDSKSYKETKRIAPDGIEILGGKSGLLEIVNDREVDIVVNAVVGADGFLPSLQAIENGKRLCLANKEALVAGGKFIMEAAKFCKGEIVPVDSEHSAILQSLRSGEPGEIKRIILTASGGPFWWRNDDISRASKLEVLTHPTWSMGNKISVDSATMVNKGFEIIEAHWLFGVPYENIEVLIHPESIVHSMVEFVDNSVIAQLSPPDMSIPIQYALFHPKRLPSACAISLDLSQIKNLSFYSPPEGKYPAFELARSIGEKGGNLPAGFVGADDVVVQAFLDGRINFSQIYDILAKTVENINYIENPTCSEILETIEIARTIASENVARSRLKN